MKVVILAGGFGTRLSEETAVIPKPMVEIGHAPIIWHIMKTYAHWGFNEFVIALGYKAESIKNYFLHYGELSGDFTVDLGKSTINHISQSKEDWVIHLVDTGIETLTGGRLKRLQNIIGDETFLLTYGDGVSDVDINAVLKLHHARDGWATLTAVRPTARFGGISFVDDHVTSFAEKRQIDVGWINGGFMVLDPTCFEYLKADEDILEVDLLERLAKDKKLVAYKHKGFWQCMDTARDRQTLVNMWDQGNAPWKLWKD